MHLVTAIIKPHTLDDVKDALRTIGITGLTVSEVRGFGRQGGKTETYRGARMTIHLRPKIKVELVVANNAVERVVAALSEAARTGDIGDGKIFVTPVEFAMRIRTGEVGADVL